MKKLNRKAGSKLARHQVTFEADTEQQALMCAQIGIGNREIARRTGLSDHQITYRLHKAKLGLGREHGFRVDWRNGNSPYQDRVLRELQSVMRQEIERKLVPLYVHPTPKVVAR